MLNNDNTYTLNVNQIDTQGVPQKQFKINCKKLILAAGTMGSLELLLRSQHINKLLWIRKLDKIGVTTVTL